MATVKASAQFVRDFNAVMRAQHIPADEIPELKAWARADMDAAVECFRALAAAIETTAEVA